MRENHFPALSKTFCLLNRTRPATRTVPKSSLQLRVLRLGLIQDGNVGVGVFPEAAFALAVFRLHGVSPTRGLQGIGVCQNAMVLTRD
jgi:hypothetical protein